MASPVITVHDITEENHVNYMLHIQSRLQLLEEKKAAEAKWFSCLTPKIDVQPVTEEELNACTKCSFLFDAPLSVFERDILQMKSGNPVLVVGVEYAITQIIRGIVATTSEAREYGFDVVESTYNRPRFTRYTIGKTLGYIQTTDRGVFCMMGFSDAHADVLCKRIYNKGRYVIANPECMPFFNGRVLTILGKSRPRSPSGRRRGGVGQSQFDPEMTENA